MPNSKQIFVKGWAFAQMKSAIGDDGFEFLVEAFESIESLLPHLEADPWITRKTPGDTRVSWGGPDRLEMQLVLQLDIRGEDKLHRFRLETKARRRRAERGVGAQPRTIDLREFDLCRQIIERAGAILGAPNGLTEEKKKHARLSLRAIRGLFVEHVVGAHLEKHLQIKFDMGQLFSTLRELAEQSYENKAITYGLVIRSDDDEEVPQKQFPSDFFERKRYRALSDGYRTAFEVSKTGKLRGLRDLESRENRATGTHYFPEWCRHIAAASAGNCCGVALTRQGDVLVFDGGSLRFSYRAGRWKYWSHSHAINIFRNRMRIQHVREDIVTAVVNKVYRVVLDVSFRRSGCLFVLLRNRDNLSRLAGDGDAIGATKRDGLDAEFDDTLAQPTVRNLTTTVLVELSALDGGVILDNHGRVLAYGAVLKTHNRSGASEGSRTKAAISSSAFGVAVKASSDGDISFFDDGALFLRL